jgi:hypothetical protein
MSTSYKKGNRTLQWRVLNVTKWPNLAIVGQPVEVFLLMWCRKMYRWHLCCILIKSIFLPNQLEGNKSRKYDILLGNRPELLQRVNVMKNKRQRDSSRLNKTTDTLISKSNWWFSKKLKLTLSKIYFLSLPYQICSSHGFPYHSKSKF